ncbi:hypothetical protein SUGI_0965060 [Cryptomeria japonica]|nr:hypothetical protein SUGI_0965060 [Cryptomeria japonica]
MLLRKTSSWQPPEIGWIKCNFDGCSKGNPRVSRAGGLIRYHNGKILLGYGSNRGMPTNKKTKASMAWMGLLILQIILRKNFILEGDSKLIIDWLNNAISPLWEVRGMVNKCKSILSSFDGIKIQHVYKEGNRMVDLISNQSLGNPKWRVFNFENSSTELKEILAQER